MQLRDYQLDVIQKARESIAAGNKSIVIQAACGSGKTIIASGICESAIAKGKKVLFLAPRRELIFQAIDRLSDYGLGDETAILMANEEADNTKPIQVASVWTYVRRIQLKDSYNWFHKADIIIVDECHGSLCPTYKKVLTKYDKNVIKIGLSATPSRSDGRGLGKIYDKIISAISIEELIKAGNLVDVIHYGAKEQPDIKGLKVVMGDYDKKEAEKRINKAHLVGSIFENWLRIASDRQTIIFAQGVKHSIHIEKVFSQKGILIRHIDAYTPDEERAEILRQFASGDIQVITNVGILDQGYDCPAVSCVVLGVIVKHIGRFLQMGGRCLRPHKDKTSAIIIDHGKNLGRLGFVTDAYDWELSDKEKAWKKKKPKEKQKKLIECSECRAMHNAKCCPQCGTEVPFYGRKVETTDEDLQEITRGKAKKHKVTMAEKRRFYGQLEYERRMRGYKEGWMYHKFKAKFGVAPHHSLKDVGTVRPDAKFFNWIKYQNIKWSKSQHKHP